MTRSFGPEPAAFPARGARRGVRALQYARGYNQVIVMTRLALVFAAALAASGCVTSKAAAPVERPTLEVPHAPPRVIDPVPAPEPTLPEPVGDLPPEKPAPPVTKSKPASPPRDTAKPDTKLEPPPAADPAPAPPATTPAPPPPLRTPATADTAAAERQVRDILSRAQGLLKNVDYPTLTTERRSAYDQAKDWIDGAEAALRTSNFELARETAEKAEKLAKELQGR